MTINEPTPPPPPPCLHQMIATMVDVTTNKPTAWMCSGCWTRFLPVEKSNADESS